MKLTTLTAALAVTLAFAQTAHAREHHYRQAVYHRHGVYHVAARYTAARYFSATEEQNSYSGWGEQNDRSRQRYRSWDQQSDQSRWRYRESAAQAFGWSTHAARRERFAAAYNGGERTAYQGGIGRRPSAWCGWQMRQLVGGDPGVEYNLARNWAHWGHAGPPGIGAVVVWAHHVGKIVGQENGQWIIQSGNDGNRVRTRPLPIGRAIAVRWG
jgi:hypothetical protein